jgi:hypothetical protein
MSVARQSRCAVEVLRLERLGSAQNARHRQADWPEVPSWHRAEGLCILAKWALIVLPTALIVLPTWLLSDYLVTFVK